MIFTYITERQTPLFPSYPWLGLAKSDLHRQSQLECNYLQGLGATAARRI
jgi:hypothetical protein